VSITLHVDTSSVEAGLKVLGAEGPKAVGRALDRTVTNVNTVMVRKVAGEMGLAQKHVRDRVRVLKTGGGKIARIYASNQQTPLTLFDPRGPEPSRGRGRGIVARTKTRHYPRAFFATMGSGHRGVFEYIGTPGRNRRSPGAWRDNLRIREVREASVASVWIHHGAEGQKRGNEMLPKNLAHEVQFLLNTKVQTAFNRSAGIRRVAL
jgi:hypothetical protein